MKEYLAKLQTKNNYTQVLEEDLQGFASLRSKIGLIEFFQKKQTKFKAIADWYESDKVGQGVSAWGKSMNVLFAAYSRAIEAHFNKYLKPEFIYANGKSERCVGAHFHSLFANHTDTKICDSKNTDVNEFDSSNTDAQAEYDALNLERCRVPEVLIQMYKAQRHVWKLNCPDTIMVEGEQKQHSGQPFTLIFNTATNMSWIGADIS